MNQTGSCAFVLTATNSLSIFASVGGTFVNSSSPTSSQIGVYLSGSVVVVKPGITGTTNFRIIAFRARASQ
jgi:hypothetical protein